MTEAQILPILSAWNDAMRECEERMDQLAEIVGPLVDRPLGDAIYRVMGAYTKTVADLIGWSYDTLEAWWTEHQLGGRPMKIGFCGEPMRTIATIEDLAAFIAEDLARGEG